MARYSARLFSAQRQYIKKELVNQSILWEKLIKIEGIQRCLPGYIP